MTTAMRWRLQCVLLSVVRVSAHLTHQHHKQQQQHGAGPDRRAVKVSLAPYRRASAAIFRVLQRVVPADCAVEKGGIDEVYVDISRAVARDARDSDARDLRRRLPLPALEARALWGATLVAGGAAGVDATIEDEADVALLLGARWAARMREAVFQELRYTASAGIAHNKQMAKLGAPALCVFDRGIVLTMACVICVCACARFQDLRRISRTSSPRCLRARWPRC